MTWYEILIILAAVALVVFTIVFNVVRKQKGKSSCGCDCTCCPVKGACSHATRVVVEKDESQTAPEE